MVGIFVLRKHKIIKIFQVDEGLLDNGYRLRGKGGDRGLNSQQLQLKGWKEEVESSPRKEGKPGECGGLRARRKYVKC